MSWERLSDLFVGALALPAGERDAWLEEVCSDATVRAEVAAMVQAHERAVRAPLAIESWLRDGPELGAGGIDSSPAMSRPARVPPAERGAAAPRARGAKLVQSVLPVLAAAAVLVALAAGVARSRRSVKEREVGAPPPSPPRATQALQAAPEPRMSATPVPAAPQRVVERADGREAGTGKAQPPPAGAGESSVPEPPPVRDGIAAAQEHFRRQEEVQRRRLAAGTASHGAESILVANAWFDLGTALALQGRLEEAESAFATALGLFERRSGGDHPAVANALRDLGRVRHLRGRPGEALPLLRRALAIAERLGGERGAPARGASGMRMQLARVAWLVERTPAALEDVRAAAAEVLALEHPAADRQRADALTLLGSTLVEADRACEAVAVLRDALLERAAATGPAAAGPAVETRCALRDAERACGDAGWPGELAACPRDLRRWGLADPQLVARLEANAPGGV